LLFGQISEIDIKKQESRDTVIYSASDFNTKEIADYIKEKKLKLRVEVGTVLAHHSVQAIISELILPRTLVIKSVRGLALIQALFYPIIMEDIITILFMAIRLLRHTQDFHDHLFTLKALTG